MLDMYTIGSILVVYMKDLDTYEQQLLDGWEDVFKKGQLTLWIMLSLKDGPKHMAEIKDFIGRATNGALSADDKSMYRALRRYYDVELIDFGQEPGQGGPDRKVYRLTDLGLRVLEAFTKRNITDVFYNPAIRELIERNCS
jgi:PadR family transcriptional regulator PadR